MSNNEMSREQVELTVESDGEFSGNIFGWERSVCRNATSYYNQRLNLPVVTEFCNPENKSERVFIGVKNVNGHDYGYAQYRDDSGYWEEREIFLEDEILVGDTPIGEIMAEVIFDMIDLSRREFSDKWRQGKFKRVLSVFHHRNGEKDPRVISVGFYDLDGTWFYIFDAQRPREDFSHFCARGVDGDFIVRYTPEHGQGVREMALESFIKNLPKIDEEEEEEDLLEYFLSE